MDSWIFQGNPDIFDIDSYIGNYVDIRWEVRQKHYAKNMNIGDEVFLWKASVSKKEDSGVVAYGHLTSKPADMEDDAASMGFWTSSDPHLIALRVQIKLDKVNIDSTQVIKRDWLKDDPITKGLQILSMASQTNYKITEEEAQRLRSLVLNTGRDWSSIESQAGLWAYTMTKGKTISKLAGEPVAEVTLTIGRTVSEVYNKAMNFRALDSTDERKGFSGRGQTDKNTWSNYFDVATNQLDITRLDADYRRLWHHAPPVIHGKPSYAEFGDAPNDDPAELQQFAAKVRKGQPAFRKNLLKAYGERCAISGHGTAEVLEAVHILDHATSGINELNNGLLLRGDVHSLFDARLLDIDPETFAIVVDTSLMDTPYRELQGRRISARVDGTQIDPKYLMARKRGNDLD